ncbi:DUF6531 domain-containing protein, partial [Escherichia coli]|uniref:DUF6531 domain-containing protein n=1 Tax=Escherichia coli TaxID=562 RepID=UPI003EE37ACA
NTFTLITSSLGFTFNICAILAFGYHIIRQLFCVTDNIVCFVYRSQARGVGIFGSKWTDEWSASLTVQGNQLHFTDSEGVVLY